MNIQEKKLLAIELLADGELNKTEIAKHVGIARQTLYDWMNNEEFVANLDERLQNKKKFVQKMFDGKLQFVIDKLYDLANDDSNKRVQAQVLQYLADRSLGKITQRHELTTEIKDNNYSDDDIKQVFDELEEDTD